MPNFITILRTEAINIPTQIKIDNTGREQRIPIDNGFQFTEGVIKISHYEGRRFKHHWHADPEFTIIVDGEMNYQVNDRVYHLKKGQAVYVNSNVLHSGWNEVSECRYIPINFAPQIIGGESDRKIRDEYVEPIISSPNLTCIVFDSENDENDAKIITLFAEMQQLMRSKPDFFELKIKAKLCEAWSLILPTARKIIAAAGDETGERRVTRVKKALDYIDEHYAEQITLNNLAEACGLSRSEICRSFKFIVKQTPMEYLARTRIRKSLPMLSERDMTVTQIAEKCGFSGSSYFSECFKKYMSVTPLEYGKKAKY